MQSRALYLACYDIRHNGRRRAALKVARRFTSGGQKSVHECWLTAAERTDLLDALAAIIDLSTDRILLVGLDGRRQTVALGVACVPMDADLLIVGAAA